MSETPEPRYCAPGDGVEGGYTNNEKDPMSEEPKKKKGRGPSSTAAGDLLIYTDADGIEWPGRHVRFNKGKTMKLPNKKQVACTITVQLDGYTKPSIVPYLDVTYLPKGDAAAKIAAEPIEQQPPPSPQDPFGKDLYALRRLMDRDEHPPLPAGEYLATPNTEWRSVTDVIDETDVVWDNELQKAYVMVDEDGVVFTYEVEPGIETLADLERLMQLSGWEFGEDAVQPPIKVYAIVDSGGAEIATYIPEIDRFIVHNSHDPSNPMAAQVAAEEFAGKYGEKIRDHVKQHSESFTLWLFTAGDIEGAFIKQERVSSIPRPESIRAELHQLRPDISQMQEMVEKTAADAKEGDMVWYIGEDAERHFSPIHMVDHAGIWFDHHSGESDFLPNEAFGTEWGFVSPYRAAGELSAAEPIVDAIQEDRAAEEPKTAPTEMLALRWNDEILGPERLGYRIPGRQHIYGDRHYVIQTPGDNVIFAPGVTSILKATMPKPEELFKWAVEKFRSWEEYQRYMTLAQGRGSVIHGAIADAINGVLPDFQDTAAWLSYLAAACSRNGCKGMEREWLTIVQRSVASIRQWAADYKVVFLMVEKALYTPSGYAGQVDFLLEMDSHIQNVKSTRAALREAPRRIIAIVDLKTGSDSDQYPAQLAYYRRLLLEGFPHIKKVIDSRYPAQSTIDGYDIPLYLLFPKTSWRKAPTYSFLDRSLKADEYAANEMQHHIELFKFKRRKPAGVTRLTGPANFNVTNEGVLKYTTLEEVWMDKIAQGDLEPVEDINEEEDQE